MENARLVVHPCIFQWDIYNPFLPFQTIEAYFYSGFPTPTQWKVTLIPIDRRIDTWIFLLRLSCDFPDEENPILALRVQVDFSLRGRSIARNEMLNCYFQSNYLHPYYFHTQVLDPPNLEAEPPCLNIKVEMQIQGPPNIFGSGWSLDEEDQIALSEDLNRLLTDHRYFNMTLLSSDALSTFKVHSCIIYSRWNNFFDIHSLHRRDQDAVQTNISEDVLLVILTYLYSGKISRLQCPNLSNVAFMLFYYYVAELFQVIDHYTLYHLYKVFVKSDSQQLRKTSKALVIYSWDFPLENVDGQTLNNPSYVWDIDEYAGYSFTLRIQIFMNVDEDDVWLSYSLQSRSLVRIHVHVNLQFAKNVKKTRKWGHLVRSWVIPTVETVLDFDYPVNPNEIVESGEVHFMNGNSIFDDFNTEEGCVPSRDEVRHFIRWNLNLSDGTSVMEVKNIFEDTIQSDRERFGVLGDSMYALLGQEFEADLQIGCPAEILINPNNSKEKINVEQTYSLHKAIFAARVPNWEGVLENVAEVGKIPDEVTCNLSSEAFRHVLQYIYTGKMSPIDDRFLDEIKDFAVRGKFPYLETLVSRKRTRSVSESCV